MLRPLAGQRTVRVVAGGRQWQRTIGLEEGQQYSERVVLESVAEEAISVSNPGEIYVESNPVGARVYLNGVEQEGSTPINLTDLSPGSYTLELRLPQYEVATVRAEVRSLDILKINETLVPTFATVSIASDPSGALLYIDGEQVGSTPFRGRVERGQRQLRLELPQ